MPLVRKMYRGMKVWAEVDDTGQPLVQGGLVRIRYSRDDERTYSVKAAEVEEVDEARLVSRGRRKAPPRSGAPGKSAPRTSAPRGDLCDPDRLPRDTVVVFTDGACYGNPGPAGIGILLEWRGRRKEISRFLGPGTNNIAELTAIREALKSIHRRDLPVRLFTDSAYAIGVLSRRWKVQANRELVEEIRALMEEFVDLVLCKVRGHAGDERNERVDQLARDGIDRQPRR